MSSRSLSDLAKKMREIDIAMLSTHAEDGAIGDPTVSLTFQGSKAFSVAVEGKAKLLRDKKSFKEHWTPDLDQWFKDGIDTKGVVMINVHATRVHYWDGEEDGEVKLSSAAGKRH
jgi:general stress protein 26